MSSLQPGRNRKRPHCSQVNSHNFQDGQGLSLALTLQNTDCQLRLPLRDGARATTQRCHQSIPAKATYSAQTISKEERMRRMIFAAVLAAILPTTVACGGNGGDGGEQRLHPPLSDATFVQIKESREYVTLTASHTSKYLSGWINAVHEQGMRSSTPAPTISARSSSCSERFPTRMNH